MTRNAKFTSKSPQTAQNGGCAAKCTLYLLKNKGLGGSPYVYLKVLPVPYLQIRGVANSKQAASRDKQQQADARGGCSRADECRDARGRGLLRGERRAHVRRAPPRRDFGRGAGGGRGVRSRRVTSSTRRTPRADTSSPGVLEPRGPRWDTQGFECSGLSRNCVAFPSPKSLPWRSGRHWSVRVFW